MRNEYFDLMILDLVLPIEGNGECSAKNGVDFLDRIYVLIKPFTPTSKFTDLTCVRSVTKVWIFVGKCLLLQRF